MVPKKIALLTDSCADIAPCDLKENIFTVPLRILCADGEYRDGVDITPADIYRRLHYFISFSHLYPSPQYFGYKLDKFALFVTYLFLT